MGCIAVGNPSLGDWMDIVALADILEVSGCVVVNDLGALEDDHQ